MINISWGRERSYIISCPSALLRKEFKIMFFGNNKKDKDVRLTDKQYKDLVGGMSRKERKEFERRQDQLRRDREDDRLEAWLDFEDEMDDM